MSDVPRRQSELGGVAVSVARGAADANGLRGQVGRTQGSHGRRQPRRSLLDRQEVARKSGPGGVRRRIEGHVRVDDALRVLR